jgi:hypothetical protein
LSHGRRVLLHTFDSNIGHLRAGGEGEKKVLGLWIEQISGSSVFSITSAYSISSFKVRNVRLSWCGLVADSQQSLEPPNGDRFSAGCEEMGTPKPDLQRQS